MFMDITTKGDLDGIDPFESCITIASACNLVFRRNFLEHQSIGIIPANGYRCEHKQSIKALKWLKYLSEKDTIDIMHAGNRSEKQIGSFFSGWYRETEAGEREVYEFHGCFWHGCEQMLWKIYHKSGNWYTPWLIFSSEQWTRGHFLKKMVTKAYEVWHFDEVSQYNPDTKEGGIFTEYVNTFLKIKQEASGWPEWCLTDQDKHTYIKNYFEKEGIWLEEKNIKENPGLRKTAKLILNR
ncbi:Hypothetical predicted protein [Mytilus galloprovincialis]|uniref:Uncharacterized protein n=1 Tax=Mytilus galloprovincialis TaxID=29158 RepID=A0A8B6BYD0_MYTGA|nr:Hypothetical predicted protein [Mytilus galloprovincialis]